MGNSVVTINTKINFDVDDGQFNRLIETLNQTGALILDCEWCGLTIIPQVRRHFSENKQNEFEVECVGCKKNTKVRYYGNYGFLIK